MHANFPRKSRVITLWLALLIWGASQPAVAQNSSLLELRPVECMVSAQKLRMLTSHAEFRGGTLAIADYARLSVQERKGKDRQWHPYLHLVRVGKNAEATSCASFRVNPASQINDPQFSPDGKKLLFKVGDISSSNSGTQLAVWDLKSRYARLGPKNVVYKRVSWSPDSRYLAYAMGGEITGYTSTRNPLELFTYDIRTHISRSVERNIGVRWMNWAAPHTLFYAKLSGEFGASSTDSAIYSVVAPGGAPRLVSRNASAPYPALDGKSLFYAGWSALPENVSSFVQRASGVNYSKIGSKSLWSQSSEFAPTELAEIHWLNNKKAVFLRATRKSPRAQVEVMLLDARSGAMRKIATLDSRDIRPYSPTEVEPQFRIVAISPESKTVFVQVEEVIGNDPPLLVITSTLRAVNLTSGKVVGGIKYGTAYGLDFAPA